jgi:hypothetical protein
MLFQQEHSIPNFRLVIFPTWGAGGPGVGAGMCQNSFTYYLNDNVDLQFSKKWESLVVKVEGSPNNHWLKQNKVTLDKIVI